MQVNMWKHLNYILIVKRFLAQLFEALLPSVPSVL